MSERVLIAGRYAPGDLIGRGGIGKVYQGEDTQTGDIVAIKALKTEAVEQNPGLVERFRREGEALRRLNHPNIVQILETVEENGQHYIIMEYVPGGSLRDLLRLQPQLPIRQVLDIALELSDALARAHHLNIIHRDIKPSNVLLDAKGRPRLVDFGVARIEDTTQVTQTGSIIGTYSYLSPEAFTGGHVDARSDIWAFGIMLYEMLAGRRPFDDGLPATVMMAIVQKPLPPLALFRPDVPGPVITLIEAMLTKDLDQRISSARLVGAELEAIIQGVPTPLGYSSGITRTTTTTTPPSATLFKDIRSIHNLPTLPTGFVGRTDELADIQRHLDNPDCRLLTLVGVGGSGKSRLAIQAALENSDKFVDGVYFVPLAPLNSADFLVSAITEALQFSFFTPDDAKNQLLNYLRQKHLLLVLDNFEHVLEGAGLLVEILEKAPGVKLLVTSRERLNLQEEWTLQVSGMTCPENEFIENAEDYSAIQLLVQSARKVNADFALSNEERPHAIRICHLVEGMPLGIELAAAWVRMLSLAEIVREIEQDLDFLATSMRNMPERHRSLRAVFEYSWRLMTETERTVFCKLSVFRGGFTRDAAQRVAGASLPLLTALVDKSLLIRHQTGRYDVHMLLRQYAQEKLDENPAEMAAAYDRHSAYYADYLAARFEPLKMDKQTRALNEIEEEIKNIRAGCRWAARYGKAEEVGKYIESLDIFFDIRGWYQEGEETFRAAAEGLQAALPHPEQNLVFAKALARHGVAHTILSNHEDAERLLNHSLEILRRIGDEEESAFALNALGNMKRMHGQFGESKQFYAESLAIREKLGDRWFLAGTYISLSYLANAEGDYEEARRWGEQSLRLRRELGDMLGAAASLKSLGSIYYNIGDYEKTRLLLEESVSIRRRMRDRPGVASSLAELGDVMRELGHYAEAKTIFDECLAIHTELGDRRGLEIALVNLGRIANATGNYAEGRQQCQTSVDICRELDLQWGVAFSLHHLAVSEFGLGNIHSAVAACCESLKIASGLRATALTVYVTVGIARLLMHEGQRARAVELLSLVLNHPRSNNESRSEARRLMAALASQLPAEAFAAAQARGKILDLYATVDELLAARV